MTGHDSMVLGGVVWVIAMVVACAVAALLDWRAHRLPKPPPPPEMQWHCVTCGMDIIDLGTHGRLYHGYRPVGIEDDPRWSA